MQQSNLKYTNQNYPKRLFDFLLAFFSLLLFSPVILIIWILIIGEDGKTAIFSQERIGLNGKVFVLYKFRTMKINAEKNDNPQLCRNNDPRLTKIGCFLRRHHLDEFPQLWNILKGDMSFVGYRPERQFFINQILKENPNYVHLYKIRPGIFSKATLYNGYTDTMDKMLIRLEMDLEYLQNQSFMYDLKVIYLTTMFIITGKKF